LNIGYKGGTRQLELLQYRKGETDLVYRKGKFFLLAVCDIPDPDEQEVDAALGIDMGIVNIAVTDDGDIFTNETIENNRRRHHRLRRDLQRNKSRSTRKKLKRLSGQQASFQKDTNHRISKRLVELAERTGRMIAIEDLNGIRQRARAVRQEQRGKHSNWSSAQLRDFLTYKAKLAGVKLVVVDPHYTSQDCPACGYRSKTNRRSQCQFQCCVCGYENHADVVGALNISRLGCPFNQPHVPTHRVRDNLLPSGG
jgi:IS605 OrfB family transposase